MSLPVSGKSEVLIPKGIVLIDQNDLYTHIFSNFINYPSITNKFIVFTVTEYIRSLTQFQIPVQHYVYELVINAIVKDKAFYQLHQFLMCHVVTDSKPLVGENWNEIPILSYFINVIFALFFRRHAFYSLSREFTHLLISWHWTC